MTSHRSLVRLALRSLTTVPKSHVHSSIRSRQVSLNYSLKATVTGSGQSQRSQLVQKRWHSAPPGENRKAYDFKSIVELLEKPTQEAILIDVREPHEYEAGFIPTALNLPISSQPDGLFLPAEDFADRFGFQKPPADKPIVFYCRSGVRSSAAANLARQVGYTDVSEYRGSWNDWVKQGGQHSKAPEAGKPGSGGDLLGSN